MSLVRILLVDDFEPWRRVASSTPNLRSDWQVVDQASNGADAVQKALELEPDLILLDFGLLAINGITVARQIRRLISKSKIVFLSENNSFDVVNEALNVGARGYLLKSDEGRQVIAAVQAVLQGNVFISEAVSKQHFLTRDVASDHT